MDMLMDVASRLQATEHFVDEVRADKVAEAAYRYQILLCTQPTTETSRGHTHRWQTPDEPQQAATRTIADISDAMRAQVADQMRGATVIVLITSEEDPESEKIP